MSVWNNHFLKKDKIITFFSHGWLQKMSVGRRELWAWCRGNITAVSWCVFIVTLIPQGKTPFTTTMPAASLWQEVLKHTVHFTKEIQKAQVWVRIKIYVKLYTHTHSHLQIGACCWSRVKYCVASPSRYRLPPLPSSSLLLPRTRRPAVRRDAIYHRRNNYWRRFIVRKFQANSSSPSFSLFIFLLPLCFFLVWLPTAPFPFLLHNDSLRGSSSAMLQVTLSLSQAHLCRSQPQRSRGPGVLRYAKFSFFSPSLISNDGKSMGNCIWYYLSNPTF